MWSIRCWNTGRPGIATVCRTRLSSVREFVAGRKKVVATASQPLKFISRRKHFPAWKSRVNRNKRSRFFTRPKIAEQIIPMNPRKSHYALWKGPTNAPTSCVTITTFRVGVVLEYFSEGERPLLFSTKFPAINHGKQATWSQNHE